MQRRGAEERALNEFKLMPMMCVLANEVKNGNPSSRSRDLHLQTDGEYRQNSYSSSSEELNSPREYFTLNCLFLNLIDLIRSLRHPPPPPLVPCSSSSGIGMKLSQDNGFIGAENRTWKDF